MRLTVLIIAALAALASAPDASAQSGTRPLDSIYGPARPGDAQPARPPMSSSPATRSTMTPRTYDPGSRPLDRIYGPGSGGRSGGGLGTAGRGGGVGGGTAVGRPQGGTGLGAGTTRPSVGATRKPAGPAYRGGSVGTRPRFSRSPSLSAPRR